MTVAVSFWHAADGVPRRRAALASDVDVDVCVVGAGYTGLWTAYYLKRAAPDLRIAVLEREFAGYGASGRNGGWLMPALPGVPRRYARERGRDAVFAFQRAMDGAIDEVARVAVDEGIDADLAWGGVLRVACSPAQAERLRALVEGERAWGGAAYDLLDTDATAARVAIPGAVASAYSPRGARIQPAKLVRGLARVVEGLGVAIYESTPALSLAAGLARTPGGAVHARYVLRATEGFTPLLPGLRRSWLPMNSAMLVTPPLPDDAWDRIGWRGGEVLGDAAHVFMYAQRTADGRIALGGRGVPYRYGSGIDRDGQTGRETIRRLRSVLVRRFPAAGGDIAQAWCGTIAVPRDWCASVWLDPRTGVGGAGGYCGHGVAAANLAGRTLRDLVLGEASELTRLPWVGHTARRWEPEPLRWLGVRAVYAAYRAADRHERWRASDPRTSPIARAADALSGRV